jgi:hypothetical protein
MSEPPTPPANAPKTRLATALIVLGIIGFFIFSLSIGGLTWWLLRGTKSVSVVNKVTEGNVIELFNGTDLEGWNFDPAVWSVRDGVIYGRQLNGGNLFWRGAEVEDFELRFRFRLMRGNSGIHYRARELKNRDVGGYEFEIYSTRTGELADRGTDRAKRELFRSESVEKIDSEWHEGVIIASGARLIHQLDGKVVCDVEDTDPAAPCKGVISLGAGGGTIVEFKDLRLKRLKTKP